MERTTGTSAPTLLSFAILSFCQRALVPEAEKPPHCSSHVAAKEKTLDQLSNSEIAKARITREGVNADWAGGVISKNLKSDLGGRSGLQGGRNAALLVALCFG
jgi:hypothetical protein